MEQAEQMDTTVDPVEFEITTADQTPATAEQCLCGHNRKHKRFREGFLG